MRSCFSPREKNPATPLINRRSFLCTLSGAAAAANSVPVHLAAYEELYRLSPREASLAWFRAAKFGLFIHYGLYSLLGRHEQVMFREKIRPRDYAELAERFTAEKFDADAICRLALEAGMRYVNLVAKHCDGFCLWNTRQTEFNSVNSTARRDLVAEMAEACRKRRLGLFVFYEHGFDWRHPHGPAPWDWNNPRVRPRYEPPDDWYAPPERYDFQRYLDYVSGGIRELLTQYGPVAGVWLDGAGVPASGDACKFRLSELYAMIRRLQPHALISYKWGVEGSEDFQALERPQLQWIKERRGRPLEICWTTQKGSWGWMAEADHYTVEEIWADLERARALDANYLLNIGPLGDGSVHPEQQRILRELGQRLQAGRAIPDQGR